MKTYATPEGDRYKLFADMLRQPHLLIAGATGSGKSVAINALLYTALFDFPGSVAGAKSLVLIDPKRVELVQYKALPHVLRYASEPCDRVDALTYSMRLCEDRYKRMQRCGLRKYPGGDVYIVIDEFADLICTQKHEIVPLVQRLAQIGRAANIHIILATQTPIAKVLPTEIKCNFDSRLALRTRSAQDSRNITGAAGCERLPRYGYGEYITPERDDIVQIPRYDDAELEARIEWWTRQK